MLAYSVRSGAIRSAARSPIATAYASRGREPRGAVFGSVIMKKRKTSTSGEVTSTHHSSKPPIGPRCQRAVSSCPVAASSPIPAANAAQKPSATRRSRSRERIANPPARMIARASASHADIGPHQKSSGSARVSAEEEEAGDEPDVRGVEDVRAAPGDHVLREQRHGRGADEDPPAADAPPVAVLGSGHAQDERDAVAGQERARRPEEHALPPGGDPDLEQGAGRERQQDLRDREPEVEARPGRSPAAR